MVSLILNIFKPHGCLATEEKGQCKKVASKWAQVYIPMLKAVNPEGQSLLQRIVKIPSQTVTEGKKTFL